ncbi:MAG: TetR/AcrR family transcriptional regulator [Myxococcales bacterium]|nr:TetR/AcrR family transcriptional regulator [Myxococcales bacterium]
MSTRRKAWNGTPPATPKEARRILLSAARVCVERYGAKAGLTHVAQEAGVTRQTVYRYFENTEDLFMSAAALASGGFLENLRQRVLEYDSWPERVIECVVYSIVNLSADPALGAMNPSLLSARYLLELGFVQEEMAFLSEGQERLSSEALDELAELLVRVLLSFLNEPDQSRDEVELRQTLTRWLRPTLESYRAE